MLERIRNFYRGYIFTWGWYGRNMGCFIIAIFLYFKLGGLGLLLSIPIFIFFNLSEIFADSKYVPWIWGIIFSVGAIYFANWFFDDIKKTLSFPLTIICYVVAKHLLPETVSEFLSRIENYLIPGRRYEDNTQVNKRKKKQRKYNRLIVHGAKKIDANRGKRRTNGRVLNPQKQLDKAVPGQRKQDNRPELPAE